MRLFYRFSVSGESIFYVLLLFYANLLIQHSRPDPIFYVGYAGGDARAPSLAFPPETMGTSKNFGTILIICYETAINSIPGRVQTPGSDNLNGIRRAQRRHGIPRFCFDNYHFNIDNVLIKGYI